MHELRALELKASQARRGLWSRNGVVETLKDVLTPRGNQRDGTASSNVVAHRINVNTATTAELQSLPGIGPKLAELIVRSRPLKSLSDLDALPGFGPKKMEVLRDLISF